MKNIKQFVVGGLCVAMLLGVAPAAQAATATQAQIAYYQMLLAQLKAQLAAIQGGSGAPAPSDKADVDIFTGTASREDSHTVELHGEIDFNNEDEARVWFEYGTSYALPYSTPSLNLDDNDDEDFSLFADDIDSNRTYYYRAVAEDEDGDYAEGVVRSFRISSSDDDDDDDDDDEDVPAVTTDEADDVDESSAELNGEVDMQDADDGYVFFVYGEDEDQVEDASDEDSYGDIDTDGDNLRKTVVDSSFDDEDDFSVTITGLDDDTEHFFRLCVEYEDEDDDEALECGDVESFETDEN